MKLVLIEWLDIHAGRGWQTLDEIEDSCEPLYCRSVGWLAVEKNGHKTIIPHLGGEKNGDVVIHGRGSLTIPNKAIFKMTVLRGR